MDPDRGRLVRWQADGLFVGPVLRPVDTGSACFTLLLTIMEYTRFSRWIGHIDRMGSAPV